MFASNSSKGPERLRGYISGLVLKSALLTLPSLIWDGWITTCGLSFLLFSLKPILTLVGWTEGAPVLLNQWSLYHP